jgi:hypothetical protein
VGDIDVITAVRTSCLRVATHGPLLHDPVVGLLTEVLEHWDMQREALAQDGRRLDDAVCLGRSARRTGSRWLPGGARRTTSCPRQRSTSAAASDSAPTARRRRPHRRPFHLARDAGLTPDALIDPALRHCTGRPRTTATTGWLRARVTGRTARRRSSTWTRSSGWCARRLSTVSWTPPAVVAPRSEPSRAPTMKGGDPGSPPSPAPALSAGKRAPLEGAAVDICMHSRVQL